MARSPIALLALALAGCFTGTFLAGQPCSSDADCGPNLRREEGRCAGASASGDASSTASSSTTLDTTAASSTSTSSSTSSASESTSTSTSTTTATSSTGALTDSTTGPTCGVGTCGDFDILLVVDNSPSMGDKDNTLLAVLLSISDVVFPLLQSACSVHFGVISTDGYARNPKPCDVLGALVRVNENDLLCEFTDGLPYASLPDFSDPLTVACPTLVGADGSTNERPFDAILRAASGMVGDACNPGFLRDDAFLIILIATDEDDHSNALSPNLWYDTLVKLRPGGVDRMFIAALVGDDDQASTACPWDPNVPPDGDGAEPAPILRAFLGEFPEGHREIGTICDPSPDPSHYAAFNQSVVDKVSALCMAP